MMKLNVAAATVMAALALSTSSASAVTYQFQTSTGDSFATLNVTNAGSGNLHFNLQAPGLDLFGSNSFLGALGLKGSFHGSISNVSGDAPVSLVNSGGPGGLDFRFDLTGAKKARLTDGESVQWTWNSAGIGATGLHLAAHVQGIAPNDGSLWVTAVPEPSTYVLMFGGMAVIGVVARRRRSGARAAAS
jgi:hypothetical protein